jgi:predicted DNA-binding transcriptional regulator AlpA
MMSKGEESKFNSTVEKLCREIRCHIGRKLIRHHWQTKFSKVIRTQHNRVAYGKLVTMRKHSNSAVPLVRLAFSADETRQILGISRATFYRMVSLGEIKPIAHEGVLRFSQREIDRYLGTTMEVAA